MHTVNAFARIAHIFDFFFFRFTEVWSWQPCRCMMEKMWNLCVLADLCSFDQIDFDWCVKVEGISCTPSPPTQPQVKIQTKYVLHVARLHGIPILQYTRLPSMSCLTFLLDVYLQSASCTFYFKLSKKDPCILSKYQRTNPAWRMTLLHINVLCSYCCWLANDWQKRQIMIPLCCPELMSFFRATYSDT